MFVLKPSAKWFIVYGVIMGWVNELKQAGDSLFVSEYNIKISQ